MPTGYESRDIATADEVLETLTQLLRSEKTAEQLKAAEHLAKYHSLFSAREAAPPDPNLIAEIDDALRRIMAHREQADEPHEGSRP